MHFRKHARFFEASILMNAVITLGLAASYATQLAKAPPDYEYDGSLYGFSWSTPWAVFFYGTVPVITILVALVNLGLLILGRLTPLHGVIISSVMLFGWTLITSLWINCQWWSPNGDIGQFCYQNSLKSVADGYDGVSNGIAIPMTVFAIFLMVIYAGYVTYAAVALRSARKLDGVVDKTELKETL